MWHYTFYAGVIPLGAACGLYASYLVGRRVVYQAAPSPRLTVHDRQGQMLFDERLTLPLFNDGGPAKASTAVIPSPVGEGRWAVALRTDGQEWRMEIVELSGGQTTKRASLLVGETAEVDGLRVSFAGLGDVAWAQVGGIPGVAEGAVAMMPTDGKAGVLSAVDGGQRDDAGAAPPPTRSLPGLPQARQPRRLNGARRSAHGGSTMTVPRILSSTVPA